MQINNWPEKVLFSNFSIKRNASRGPATPPRGNLDFVKSSFSIFKWHVSSKPIFTITVKLFMTTNFVILANIL